jgi:hypothetical protein
VAVRLRSPAVALTKMTKTVVRLPSPGVEMMTKATAPVVRLPSPVAEMMTKVTAPVVRLHLLARLIMPVLPVMVSDPVAIAVVALKA